MLRVVAWFETLAGLVLIGLAAFPFTDFCSGRTMGFDCESRGIIGVNALAPLGALLVVSGLWSIRARSARPQVVLVIGVLAVAGWWWIHLP